MTAGSRGAVLALLLSLLPLAGGCGPGGEAPSAQRERPDLVLVVVDALRADHLNPYGYRRATSPAFASLAASGVVFDDNTAQSTATLPSMVSLLRVRQDRAPEQLAAAGYQTVAFAGNPLVSRAAGFDRGFEVFLTREDTGHETWDARDVYTIVTGWLEANPRDGRPRFVYIHFMDPHFPYWPDDRASLPGENPQTSLEQRVHLADEVLASWASEVGAAGAGTPLHDTFNAERWTLLEQIDGYDREIANVDAATGVLLGALGDGGRLVIVAADHGEAFWERRLPPGQLDALPPEKRTLGRVFEHGHGGAPAQSTLRTPLIVSGYGFPVGVRVTGASANLDIAPTLLRAAGVPLDPALEGRPLQDQLAGPGAPRAPIASFCRTSISMRDPGGYRLVVPTPEGEALGVPVQLYKLSEDPHERRNLAAVALSETTEADARMLQELRAAHDAAVAGFTLFDGQSLISDDPGQAKVYAEFEQSRE